VNSIISRCAHNRRRSPGRGAPFRQPVKEGWALHVRYRPSNPSIHNAFTILSGLVRALCFGRQRRWRPISSHVDVGPAPVKHHHRHRADVYDQRTGAHNGALPRLVARRTTRPVRRARRLTPLATRRVPDLTR